MKIRVKFFYKCGKTEIKKMIPFEANLTLKTVRKSICKIFGVRNNIQLFTVDGYQLDEFYYVKDIIKDGEIVVIGNGLDYAEDEFQNMSFGEKKPDKSLQDIQIEPQTKVNESKQTNKTEFVSLNSKKNLNITKKVIDTNKRKKFGEESKTEIKKMINSDILKPKTEEKNNIKSNIVKVAEKNSILKKNIIKNNLERAEKNSEKFESKIAILKKEVEKKPESINSDKVQTKDIIVQNSNFTEKKEKENKIFDQKEDLEHIVKKIDKSESLNNFNVTVDPENNISFEKVLEKSKTKNLGDKLLLVSKKKKTKKILTDFPEY